MWEENPREWFPGKNPRSQVGAEKPNPHSVPGGIPTWVPEVEGEARQDTITPTWPPLYSEQEFVDAHRPIPAVLDETRGKWAGEFVQAHQPMPTILDENGGANFYGY